MRLHLPHHHHRDDRSPGSRAWVWLHQFELDRQLAAGVDPAGSPALAARAQLITGGRFRRGLVDHIESALARAERPPHWHSATLPVCTGEIRAARQALGALARTLKEPGVSNVRGVALAACLVNDPHGPLYQRAGADEISSLAQDAVALLGGAPAGIRVSTSAPHQRHHGGQRLK
jgi:hypothetical protein